MNRNGHYAPISPALTGLRGRCPRCGQGRLFDGIVRLQPCCSACGLNYAFADAGDGPAVFVILIAGFLILGAVLYLEFTFEPPLWVHIIVSGPLALAVCLVLLRLLKGLLIALQYAHEAAEGRLDQ